MDARKCDRRVEQLVAFCHCLAASPGYILAPRMTW
jgi:hypothetical protein